MLWSATNVCVCHVPLLRCGEFARRMSFRTHGHFLGSGALDLRTPFDVAGFRSDYAAVPCPQVPRTCIAICLSPSRPHNDNLNINISCHHKNRLSRAVAMVRQMDDLVTGDDGGDLYRLDRNQSFLNQGLDEDISKSKEGDEVEELTHGVSLLADESVHISPGFFQVFRGQAKQAACMIYYSRKDAGTPRISPKAGNMVRMYSSSVWCVCAGIGCRSTCCTYASPVLGVVGFSAPVIGAGLFCRFVSFSLPYICNRFSLPARRVSCQTKQNAAMFPVDDPTSPPLIGPSTIVVVNDARHQLQPEFLQRTTPYFFDVDSITQQYKWAKVC